MVAAGARGRCPQVKPLALALVIAATAASAQDIRGLEVCSAEKDMARRTGCLQTNVELLQQLLTRETRRAQAAEAAAAKDAASFKSDIAALKGDLVTLKAALEKTQGEVSELKKAKPGEKK